MVDVVISNLSSGHLNNVDCEIPVYMILFDCDIHWQTDSYQESLGDGFNDYTYIPHYHMWHVTVLTLCVALSKDTH